MATRFHKFPCLPKELQIAIWKLALQEPRTVRLRKENKWFYVYVNASDYELEESEIIDYFQPCDPPPPLAHVCTDSRNEAKSVYTLAFTDGLAPRYTYINFEIDTVAISDHNLYCAPAKDRLAIKYLILPVYRYFIFARYYCTGSRGVVKLIKLLEMTVVGTEWRDKRNNDSSALSPSVSEGLITRIFKKEYEGVSGWVCPKITFVGEGEEGSIQIPDRIERSL